MKRLKRFAALTAVILWGIMIIATLILAFIIYAMTLVYKILSGRNKQ